MRSDHPTQPLNFFRSAWIVCVSSRNTRTSTSSRCALDGVNDGTLVVAGSVHGITEGVDALIDGKFLQRCHPIHCAFSRFTWIVCETTKNAHFDDRTKSHKQKPSLWASAFPFGPLLVAILWVFVRRCSANTTPFHLQEHQDQTSWLDSRISWVLSSWG